MDQKKSIRPVCLITGGSSGIGLATSRLFAVQDYDIAVCGRDESKLSRAKDSIIKANDRVDYLAITADLNDVDQAKMVVEKTIEHYGRVDVLVNNAATSPMAPFHEINEETFESAININIRSLFYTTQVAWRQMLQQQSGVVVNISSLSAVDPFPGFSLYGACKAWMDLVTHALAGEGEAAGLRVYSIRPGAVETPMLRGLFPDFPADQCVQPEDVAIAVWNCVDDPENFPSGKALSITKQN